MRSACVCVSTTCRQTRPSAWWLCKRVRQAGSNWPFVVPTNGAQRSYSWPSVHAHLPPPPTSNCPRHWPTTPPRISPQLRRRIESVFSWAHARQRERESGRMVKWDSWESAAALLEWPFLVATSFSTSFFSWPANVAARGRTESAHIEKEWERKCRRKHTRKALSKAQVN